MARIVDGADCRWRDRLEDFAREGEKRKDVSRRVVAAVGVAILAKDHVLVAMHDLDAPVFPVDTQKRLGRGLGGGQAGDQIDDFFFRRVPRAMLLALPRAPDAANVFHGWPVVPDAGGLGGKHVDRAAFDAPVRLVRCALEGDQGEKPAR